MDFTRYPLLQPLIAALGKAPFAIRLVGGSVRDHLLNRHFNDFDFAAACTFPELLTFIKDSPCTILLENAQHGNLRCMLAGTIFDITILRQDTETDGRHAKIIATTNWQLDAERRDFTLNTLSVDFVGTVYDPLGVALQDLQNRRLRFIGDAAQRLQEDYLRILRFFRLQNQLELQIEPEDLMIITGNCAGLQRLSRERIRQEMIKILSIPCTKIFEQMHDTGVLIQIFPYNPPNIGNLQKLESFNPDWTLRLAALFLEQPRASEQIATSLVLSKKEKKLLQQRLTSPRLPFDAKIWLYLYGQLLSQDYLYLYTPVENITRALQQLAHETVPRFPLSGVDIMQWEFHGKQIKEVLLEAENFWLASGCTLSADKLRKLCKIN